MSAMIWVEARRGKGHLNVAANLVRALAAVKMEAHVLSSRAEEIRAMIGPNPDVYCHVLPPFEALGDEPSTMASHAQQLTRQSHLVELYRAIKPEVFVVEMWPMRRKVFDGEIQHLVKHIGQVPLVVLLREVDGGPTEESVTLRCDAFARIDHVLIRGDGQIKLEETWPCAQLLEKSEYVGYCHVTSTLQSARPPSKIGKDWLLSMGGGWHDGADAIVPLAVECFNRFADREARLDIFIPPDQVRGVKLGGRITLHPPCDTYRVKLKRCRLAILQAGYNSVLDAVNSRAATVLFPARNRFTHDEQRYRLARMEQLKCLGGCSRHQIAYEIDQLPRVVERALNGGDPEGELRCNGAEIAAHRIVAISRKFTHE